RVFLAGNLQNEQQQQQGQPIMTWGRGQQGESQQKDSNNLFQGFDGEFFAEAFSVDQETGQMLKCENDQKRHIVVVEKGLKFVSPIMSRQQQCGGYGPTNNLEDSICSMKLRENIDDVSKAIFTT
ncbi:11S globulin seed storage protein G3-like protein, partial [Tanacetum coccineum]